mmetsp:Transcript_5087/g.19072  ORF Transcript_5087/g.19072 Transcript_5087/m.19072 type:complete len:103 (-) Transcript_5087:216-524(-)
MPYKSLSDLPDSVQHVLPHHAQEIFMKAFNAAYVEYKDPKKRRGKESHDQVAFKVAWSAVKKAGYHKERDKRWHRGDEEVDQEQEEAEQEELEGADWKSGKT